MLLKIVLLAYSRGLVGSRRIEAACRQNVQFIAVSSDDSHPDTGYRQRDQRYQGQDLHQAKPDPLWDKRPKPETKPALYQPQDFRLAEDQSHAICPAGKRLHGNGHAQNGYIALKFRGAERDCGPCGQRQQCLRTPEKTKVRQVAYLARQARRPAQKAGRDGPETLGNG